MSESKNKIFTKEFLIALSNWQNGWGENQERRREIANQLVLQCENLPEEFRTTKKPCYRKRFINKGEMIPILIDNDFFEGIASWTTDKDCAKEFKGYLKENTIVTMLFKHTPNKDEVVLNINELWKNDEFIEAVENFKIENESSAKALLNFNNEQAEIVLKSTLRGLEIEDIVGMSSSFEYLCNKLGVPEEEYEEISKKIANEEVPIDMPIFAGKRSTKKAIQETLRRFAEKLEIAERNNVSVDWSNANSPHEDDLKHKP